MATPIPPAPGSAKPGELYVDLQSRALWLGVSEAVDPAFSVLISDILGIGDLVDESLVEAKAYTDSQVSTRAPVSHTHPSSQITDFTAAVQAIVAAMPGSSIPKGLIAMFSGSLAEIGVGIYAGWALCDGGGAPARPDLRDKFIMGAGNKAVGSVNPSASLTTTGGGTHIHVINGTTLTIAEMPAHNHGGATGTQSANHTHNVNLVTDAQGVHAHGISTNNNSNGGRSGVRAGDTGPISVTQNTEAAGNHQHNVDGNTGINSASHTHAVTSQGGGGSHTHTVQGGGGTHEHSISSSQIRDTIPYYALAFIIKL